MLNVILTIHLLACIAMVGVIMLQRSEGGVQGLSGGGTGGLISGRGAASVLVRTTMICALIFFCTSLVMTRLNADQGAKPNAFEQERQRLNSGSSILGTGAASPSPAISAAPATPAAPASPDPFAAVSPAPTATVPSAAAPAIPTAAPTASPPAATNSPAGSPSPSNSPQ